MAEVEDILRISRDQGCTCMYSEQELKTFPQEKLDAIFIGITELAKRRRWKPRAIGKRKKSKKLKS